MTSISERLDRLPMTPMHRSVVAIAGIGTFFDLFDIFLAGVLGTVLTQRFHLNAVSLPGVIGSSFLGMFIGAVSLGWYADRVGRRRAFLLNLAVYSLFTLLGAFATSAAMLIAARFVAGIGIGGELPLVDAYLSELLPARDRGRWTAVAYTLGFLGVPAVGLLARVLVPVRVGAIEGWRLLFVAGSLGGAIVWALRHRLPESPRWLESAGRLIEAQSIVARLEASGGGATRPVIGASGSRAPGGRPSHRLMGRTVMLWVFHIFQPVGYYGFGTLVPLVLASKGFSVIDSLTYASLVFVGYPLGSALSMPIVEHVDRRWLIVGSAVSMGVFGLALGLARKPAAIVALGFSYTVVSNVFSNAFHTFQAEIFPTAVRASSVGAAYGISRLSSGAMPFVLLPVLHQWGAARMFAVIAAAMLIVVADIGLFAPSTTGRTLDQVA